MHVIQTDIHYPDLHGREKIIKKKKKENDEPATFRDTNHNELKIIVLSVHKENRRKIKGRKIQSKSRTVDTEKRIKKKNPLSFTFVNLLK